MNKKNNRKGFTIVELVIVIAVIAILATVLVPTFGNVIDKAQASAALQEAKSVYTNYTANINYAAGEEVAGTVVVEIDDYFVVFTSSNVTGALEAIPTGTTHYLHLDEDGVKEYVGCSAAAGTTCATCGQEVPEVPAP